MVAGLDQEGMAPTLLATADGLRTWWSFRENASQDPARAMGFLDLFTGSDPNWFMLDAAGSRNAMKQALKARLIPQPAQLTVS